MLKSIIDTSHDFATGFFCQIYPKAFARPSTKYVKNQGKRNMVVVEIGTDRGYNARTMLENLDIKKMYLVDPYLWSEKDGVDLSLAKCGSNEAYAIAQKKLKKFKNKIEFILKTSDEAVDDIPDGLDFVYIDAIHTYEWVSKELKLYYPKVKKGGVIGGHDWFGSFQGVAKAVLEFAENKKLSVRGDEIDWWVLKN